MGKIFGVWLPVIAFVAIGFQHVVTNIFIVPTAIFVGQISRADFAPNAIAIFLNNAVGGAIFVGLTYFLVFRPQQSVAHQA